MGSEKTPTAARVFSTLVSTPFRALKSTLGYGSTAPSASAAAQANGPPSTGQGAPGCPTQCRSMLSGWQAFHGVILFLATQEEPPLGPQGHSSPGSRSRRRVLGQMHSRRTAGEHANNSR